METDAETDRGAIHPLEKSAWGVLLVLGYAAAVCLPLVVAFVGHPRSDDGLLAELGKGFALTGTGLLAFQFVMAARLRWIERPFGLDLVFRFHRGMGILAAVLILAHPVLLAASGGWGLLYNVRQPWFIWLGKAALLLLLILVAAAVLRERLGIAYERWRVGHNLAIVIFGMGFVHSSIVGDDLQGGAVRGLWIVILVLVLVAYGYHRVIVPWVARRRAFAIVDVRPETHDVWTLEMEPSAGRPRFDFRPGQFQFLTLLRAKRGLPVEEHPFTIASSPTESNLHASIKVSGDFTATIGDTKVGDRVAVRGPYGRFSYALRPDETDLVFIAGGIGVTPFMSMLRHMRDTDAPVDVLLLWGNKRAEDIAFREELGELAAGERPGVHVIHILSMPHDGWKGETGFVDREKILRLAGEDFIHRTYYVCGPPVMMQKVLRELRSLGVPSRRVLYERFAL